MDIVSIVFCLLVYAILLELSYSATDPSSKRFWAFLTMAMAFVMGAQIVSDGADAITYGSTNIAFNTAIGFGMFVLILIPLMRIFWARNEMRFALS